MKKRHVIAGALLAVVCSEAAFAQTACEQYTIAKGDTLGSIANAAYGRNDQWRRIYDANRNVLNSPDIISIGTGITIPCADGSVMIKTGTSESSTSGSTASSSAPAMMERTELRFLTMPYGDAPFSGVDLPKGGMISEIAMKAVEYADPNQKAEVYFIDDAKAHLQTLLPLHAFDVGFTWYRPDCNNIEPLNAADKRRCTDFMATDPVYQDTIGFYAKAGSDYINATEFEQLHGAKLCRPSGYFEFDLVQAGLVEPNVEIVKLQNSQECLRALMDGTVDVWSLNVFSAPDEIRKAGLDGEIEAIPAFEIVLNSYLLIARDHPKAQEYVDMLNVGLRKLVETGEWYDIIQWHLTEHNKN